MKSIYSLNLNKRTSFPMYIVDSLKLSFFFDSCSKIIFSLFFENFQAAPNTRTNSSSTCPDCTDPNPQVSNKF